MRDYAPPGEADRAHFEHTLQLEESRLLWCDGQDAAATLALERGLLLYSVGGIDPLDMSWSPPPSMTQEVSEKGGAKIARHRYHEQRTPHGKAAVRVQSMFRQRVAKEALRALRARRETERQRPVPEEVIGTTPDASEAGKS